MIPPSLSWWVAATLLLMTGLYVRQGAEVQTTETHTVLESLRLEIGPWLCTEAMLHKAKYTDPNVDKAWVGACRKTEGDPVNVYVGYVRERAKGKKILSPRINYPSRDPRWSYVSNRPTEVTLGDTDTPPLRVNQIVLQYAGGPKEVVLYWYQMAGQTFSDEYRYRLALMIQNLKRSRADAAIVRISATVHKDTTDAVFSEERELAASLYPVIDKNLLRR